MTVATRSDAALEKHEGLAIAEAARAGSLKPFERALAALFLVTIAALVRTAWHYAFG
ncbi:MAG TPA: hypothetical protein VGU20_31880 [Stellaceae bacterium]|nr:hypothetical protein [Stellaceae bacterium]